MEVFVAASAAFCDGLRIALIRAANTGAGEKPLGGPDGAQLVLREPDAGLERAADRARCRAQLACVQRSAWWDDADSADIVTMFETATAWRELDLVARDADEAIRDEVQRRYGITLLAHAR